MRKAIAFVVALSATATSFGQHEVGAKVGYNYLFTNYQPVLATSPLIETNGGGYHLGAYYAYSPGDNLFISAELLLSNRRWNEVSSTKTAGSIAITEEEYTYYSNHYFEIPLSVKYGFNLRKGRYGDSKYLLFFAGPSAHLLMSSRGSTQETFRIDAHNQSTVIQENTELQKQDLKNYFRPFQMGLHAGMSYSFPFGLKIDARYQYMLSTTNREENVASTIGLGKGMINQSMFMFSLGYSFVRD